MTVRFGVGADERDATVYWSALDDPDRLSARPTQVEGDTVVAEVNHFSTGLAGWLLVDDAGTTDAGPGALDGGGDAGVSTDAGPGASDGGMPDAGPVITGVTCVVDERVGGCANPVTTNTYPDVPFSFYNGPVIPRSLVEWLSSPLLAFELFQMESPARFVAQDDAMTTYDGPGVLMRHDRVLTVDIDANGPCSVPHIRCTGNTLLPESGCDGAPPDDLATPLECAVTERDASCVETMRTVVPRFWLADGAHGPGSELRTDTPEVLAAFDTATVLTFYKEANCGSYAGPEQFREYRIEVDAGTTAVLSLFARASDATCRDGLGRNQPLTRISCRGAVPLSPPPSP